MDSPSVTTSNSSGPPPPPVTANSGGCKDERKLKRMISNRQSARRSRLRKQKMLDELTAEVARLRRDNREILAGLAVTTENYLNVEAENAFLRVQAAELSHRLESLKDVMGLLGVVEADEPMAHGWLDGWSCLWSQISNRRQAQRVMVSAADVGFM